MTVTLRERGEKLQRFSLPVTIALAWAVLLGLALAAGIPFGVVHEWVWSERKIFFLSFPMLLLTFCSLALLIGLTAYLTPSSFPAPQPLSPTPVRWWFVLTLAVIAFRLSLAALTPIQPVSAFWTLTIASPVATTFFTEARQVEREGVSYYLRHYHEGLPQKPFHAATHPPGLPLTFALVRMVARHPFLQRLTPLDDATLAGLRQFGQKVLPVPDPRWDTQFITHWELRAAWWAAIFCVIAGCFASVLWSWSLWQRAPDGFKGIAVALAATTPASLWWQPAVDSLHWLVLSATMVSAVQWRHRPSWAWATVTGISGGLALWLAFKNAPPLAALFLWLLWDVLVSSNNSLALERSEPLSQKPDPLPSPTLPSRATFVCLTHLAWMLVLFVAPFLLAWLLFGFQPIATLLAASAAHHAQAGAHARSYLPWLFVNLLDFAMGLGGAWLGLTVAFFRYWWQRLRFRPSLAFCTLAVLLLLDVSGVVRGEVARLWMPFIPLLTLETVAVADKAMEGQSKLGVLSLVVLQGIMAIALYLRLEFLRPW